MRLMEKASGVATALFEQLTAAKIECVCCRKRAAPGSKSRGPFQRHVALRAAKYSERDIEAAAIMLAQTLTERVGETRTVQFYSCGVTVENLDAPPAYVEITKDGQCVLSLRGALERFEGELFVRFDILYDFPTTGEKL